jgi:hypothetical protein
MGVGPHALQEKQTRFAIDAYGDWFEKSYCIVNWMAEPELLLERRVDVEVLSSAIRCIAVTP